MNDTEREQMIEKVGIEATDRIQKLESEIQALHKYLKVVRVYGTVGCQLVPDITKVAS